MTTIKPQQYQSANNIAQLLGAPLDPAKIADASSHSAAWSTLAERCLATKRLDVLAGPFKAVGLSFKATDPAESTESVLTALDALGICDSFSVFGPFADGQDHMFVPAGRPSDT